MSEACIWQKHYDEENNVYYYNTVSGSSQWEEPEGYYESADTVTHGYYDHSEEYAHTHDYEYSNEEYYDDHQGTSTTGGDSNYEHVCEGHEQAVNEESNGYDNSTTEEYAPHTEAYDNTTTEGYNYDTYDYSYETEQYHNEESNPTQHTSYEYESSQLDIHNTEPASDSNEHLWVSEDQHKEQNEVTKEQSHFHDYSDNSYHEQQSDWESNNYGDGYPDVESTDVVERNAHSTSESQNLEDIEASQNDDHEDVTSLSDQLIDPSTLVPQYDATDLPTIDEILDFELDDESGDFVKELRKLHLLEPATNSEVEAIRTGMWCKASCKKLEILQFCLENAGSEGEWQSVIESDEGLLVSYLLRFMDQEVHPQLQDGAARCFAYAFMVCPTLWTFYGSLMMVSKSDKEKSGFVFAIWSAVARRVQFLCNLPAEGPSVGPYLGFDERDIEDFNLYDLDEYGEDAKKKPKNPFEMHGCPDANTMVSIWLLMAFQLCRSNMRQIGDSFRNRRVLKLGLEGEDGEDESLDPTDDLLKKLSELLLCSHKLKEDSYLLLIKVIAAINWQVPEKDLVGSTEIAELCAELQFQDISVSNVNVSEGLMHLLNDIGYPEHNQPESLPCLQLCYDLIMAAGYEGFFYQNDVRILIDMIIREITNLPITKPKEEIILEKEIESSDSDDDGSVEIMYRTRQNTLDMNQGMSIYDGIDGPVELFESEVCPVDELTKQVNSILLLLLYIPLSSTFCMHFRCI